MSNTLVKLTRNKIKEYLWLGINQINLLKRLVGLQDVVPINLGLHLKSGLSKKSNKILAQVG